MTLRSLNGPSLQHMARWTLIQLQSFAQLAVLDEGPIPNLYTQQCLKGFLHGAHYSKLLFLYPYPDFLSSWSQTQTMA